MTELTTLYTIVEQSFDALKQQLVGKDETVIEESVEDWAETLADDPQVANLLARLSRSMGTVALVNYADIVFKIVHKAYPRLNVTV